LFSISSLADFWEIVGQERQVSGLREQGSKISMATGFLGKKGIVIIESDPAEKRTKLARLTAKGVDAQKAYRRLLAKVEESWRSRFGEEKIRELRESLGPLFGKQLFRGLEPYPDGWRASVPRPKVLPHYPMVLHRGGYPDGS
jgi:hypothetical protein